jgi:UDP-N-acetylglucosamine:LPS N-acetylglucosamine transferase
VKRILILTASFGDGHNAAARNLRDALEQISPEVEVTVTDLYERGYKRFNGVARRAYLGVVRYAPTLWAGLFKLVNRAPWLTESGVGLGPLRESLAGLLEATRPDCVISTYPTYAQVIQTMFRDPGERPFRLVTVVTDAGSINSVWYRAPSDRFVVCDDETAAVLARGGVPKANIYALGFPVSPRFAERPSDAAQTPRPGEPIRVLYVINTGQQKAGKAIDRLLEIPRVEVTVTVGRHAELKEKLAKRHRRHGDRLQLLGWTNQMPELLMRNHLVIGKAGGAAVQEALAARCPMIVNQVIPGQETGNARLVEFLGVGRVAQGKKEVARRVREAMANGGELWQQWRARLDAVSQPDAALRIAQLALAECDRAPDRGHAGTLAARSPVNGHGTHYVGPHLRRAPRPPADQPLLCDFHIHTNYSDGRLSLPEVVDFYGERGFDCICITDHWTDPGRLIGKSARLAPSTLCYDQIDEYFQAISREARRAWRRYGMLVFTGLEFNQDGPTRRSSVHLLGLDLKAPISPGLNLPETIESIHAQGGLTVAAQPCPKQSDWAKETLYLWENQERFSPSIDAWEIANRNHLSPSASRKRLPFLANSDFHKPKHIYSWKTLLHCEKDPAAIKQCIRLSQHVSITLYRDQHPTSPRERIPMSPDNLIEIQLETGRGGATGVPAIAALSRSGQRLVLNPARD